MYINKPESIAIYSVIIAYLHLVSLVRQSKMSFQRSHFQISINFYLETILLNIKSNFITVYKTRKTSQIATSI